MTETRRPVCTFLIPLVRESDRQPHSPVTWRLLQDELLAAFGGLSGPETVIYVRRAAVAGAWSPTVGDPPVEDLSRRYTVAIPEDQVDALRGLLRRAGNSFDQEAIYLEVAGYAEVIEVGTQDGYL